MSTHSLESAAFSGVIWSFLDRFVNQFVQFIVLIVLARLLSPDDFGLIGMLTVFMLLATTLADSGFSQALVQNKNRTETDFSTAFYSNMLFASIFYGLLFFTSPWIAEFYDEARLISLSRILFCVIFFNAAISTYDARLTISLNFKTKAKINFIAVFISGVVAIICTLNNQGYWALAYQALTRAICYLLIIISYARWYPAAGASWSSFKRLFSFGSRLTLAGLLSVISGNLASLLIGRQFDAQILGYYSQGKKYPELLSTTVTAVLQRVTFPILSQIHDNPNRLLQIYRRVLRITGFIIIPTMACFAITAEPFVRVILTDKWLMAVPVMEGLCLVAMFTPINAINLNLLASIGRTDLFLKVDALKVPLSILITMLTVPYGLTTVVIGQIILKLLSFILNTYYPGKLYDYGLSSQIKELLPVFLLTSITILVSKGIIISLNNPVYQLIAPWLLGGVIYIALASLFRLSPWQDLVSVTTRQLHKLRSI